MMQVKSVDPTIEDLALEELEAQGFGESVLTREGIKVQLRNACQEDAGNLKKNPRQCLGSLVERRLRMVNSTLSAHDDQIDFLLRSEISYLWRSYYQEPLERELKMLLPERPNIRVQPYDPCCVYRD